MTQTLHIFRGSGREPLAVEVSRDQPPADIATRVAAGLHDAGHRGEAVLLGVPSNWCLAAGMNCPDIAANDRKAMLYRFEETIPLAAEDIVADFCRSGDHVLGVCARTVELRPLIDALEAAEIAVQSVSPTALLAAQAAGGDGVVVLESGEHTDVIAVASGRPLLWSLSPTSDVAVHLSLAALHFETASAPRTCDGATTLQLAGRAADDVLAGHAAPWIELRRAGLGAFDRLRLYRKPLNGALAAAAVLLLAIAGAMFMRAHQHAQHERDDQMALTDSFKKAFPGWEVPANIGAVIASEHRRIGGRSSSALPPGWDDSALITLHRVLDKLPADMSYDLQSMTFADRSFELHGRLRSYEDADKLAAAARAAGLNVTPPQTRREADGFWSFTLRAEKPAAPPPALARQD